MKYIRIFLVFLILFITNVKAYNKAPVDITELDVYEIQEAIDKGYLTYELLIKLYLDRIEAYDKNYHAIISINENAIEEAKKCDIEFQKNGRNNILWCMPIIVKDNIDVKGMATTAGSKALADSLPNEDATVIKKLKAKGMIILAKANMSQYAFSASSSSSYYGTVRNAYNLKYSSYGSSGGSAVAVAVQYAPFALGTDTNSSLRAPAAANNVIGFRSTLKLIDTKGIIAYDITRDVVGPITKTVEENALILEALTNEKYDLTESSLNGKTVAVLDQFLYGDDSLNVKVTGSTYSEIIALFENAVKKMEDAGAKIIHLKDFYKFKYYSVANTTLGGWTMCHAFNDYIKNTSSKIKNFHDLALASGNIYSLWNNYDKCSMNINSIQSMEDKKTDYREYVNKVFKENNIDAIIYPNSKNKLLKTSESSSKILSSTISPVLGLPAVSMPLGFDKDGLAYGIEFLTIKNNEKELYEIINAYEKVHNTYKLPDIAPALYEVPESVEKLKEMYETGLEIKVPTIITYVTKEFDTSKINQEIKEFFLNYNNYDDVDSKANALIIEYETLKEQSNKYVKSVKKVVSTLLIIAILLLVLISRKNKRKKRKK